jgi:histidine triad (HIT) family protein
MSENCLFCKIVRGDIPAKIVAENSDGLAFLDIDPKAPVHALVIPRTHFASLAESDDERLLGSLMALCAEVARVQGIDESGYRVVTNVRSDGGQTVDHLHFHVMGGRRMTWPPG